MSIRLIIVSITRIDYLSKTHAVPRWVTAS